MPVYKTTLRSGKVNSSGISNNFILSIDCNTNLPISHWVKRGAAFLCEID